MHAFTFIGSMVEVAMTGTALPVLLSISPSYKFNFGECPVGEHADVLCTIKNESNVLPAIFQFRKIAHFLTHPPNGKIPPGQSQDVIFSFSPNQIGMSQFTFQQNYLWKLFQIFVYNFDRMFFFYSLTLFECPCTLKMVDIKCHE